MPLAWPDDEYLVQLGRVVYSIASLEGLLVFDLPRMPEPVEGLSPGSLAGKTTWHIGERLCALAPSVADDAWREYLHRGGEALKAIAPRRNEVLHGRPATIDGQQRLHRWRAKPPEAVPISDDYLTELLVLIDEHRGALNALRPAFA